MIGQAVSDLALKESNDVNCAKLLEFILALNKVTFFQPALRADISEVAASVDSKTDMTSAERKKSHDKIYKDRPNCLHKAS